MEEWTRLIKNNDQEGSMSMDEIEEEIEEEIEKSEGDKVDKKGKIDKNKKEKWFLKITASSIKVMKVQNIGREEKSIFQQNEESKCSISSVKQMKAKYVQDKLKERTAFIERR